MSNRFPVKEVAVSVPFDNSTNGFAADNVQDAIEEALQGGTGVPRAIITFGYNGNAGTGKYLEVHHSVPSNSSPYVAAEDCTIKAFSVSTGTTTTCTIQIILNGTVVDDLSLSAAQKNNEIGINIAMVALDEVAVKVSSGSIFDPIFFLNVEMN